MRIFISRLFFAVTSVVLLATCGGTASDIPAPAPTADIAPVRPHSTAMGFTPWPVDLSQNGVNRTYAFIRSHSNLVAHHLDGGVPWDEALAGAQLPNHLRQDWSTRRSNTPSTSKVFLAVTPLNFGRDGLAAAWTNSGDNQPLRAPWTGKRLNDPDVKKAYIEYVQQAVRFFDPDFLAIGIEVNIIISKTPDLWQDYQDLNAATYRAIKQTNPNLPVFATVQYEHLRGIEDDAKANASRQNPAVRALMQHSDLLALSTYRYGDVHPNPMGPTYFNTAKSFGKRIAIAESGAMSQTTRIFGLNLPASEAGQNRFLTGLMDHAVDENFAFVVNWVAIDFTPLLAKLPASVREIAKAWVHTGLQTADGRDKPALAIWQSYLAASRP